MKTENRIAAAVTDIIREKTGKDVSPNQVVLQKTRREFKGDLTLVVFPFVKMLQQPPEATAEMLGEALMQRLIEVDSFQVVKGFLNLRFSDAFWKSFLFEKIRKEDERIHQHEQETGRQPAVEIHGEGKAKQAGNAESLQGDAERPVVVEYSSPNTNKPLHLGHIRNNLLGYSVASILEASSKKVVKVNLVNDRGIHICKSMLAWIKYGRGETPESAGRKGDKLVGDYYVKFETELRRQMKALMDAGSGEDEARRKAPLMQEAQELLRRWEARDPEVMEIWQTMNEWVYAGFDETYKRMGVDFDKIYYESDTYLLGRDIVMEGLEKGILHKKEDGSVWANLDEYKLDEKLLLRTDGTSVYMTQDIGTADLRHKDYCPEKMVYVVGNEQNHHFQVLQKVVEKLGKPYAGAIYHLSYGMVELPDGRMKSREGTVVDADDLMDEMVATARSTTEELGKTQDFSDEEKQHLYHIIGMGALKYFILKVDPKKNMLFNPEESIDFNGNTGPFIQYTHARIRSVLRKAGQQRQAMAPGGMKDAPVNDKERQLLNTLYHSPAVVQEAAGEMSPARIANYVYDVAKEFNQFYHDYSILNEEDKAVSDLRLCLAAHTARVIRDAMALLGIEVPEKM